MPELRTHYHALREKSAKVCPYIVPAMAELAINQTIVEALRIVSRRGVLLQQTQTCRELLAGSYGLGYTVHAAIRGEQRREDSEVFPKSAENGAPIGTVRFNHTSPGSNLIS